MTWPMESPARTYPLSLRKLVTQAVIYGLGFIAFAAVTYNVLVQEKWIGLGLFLAFVTLVLLVMVVGTAVRMPADKRFAVAMTDEGLRIPDALPALDASAAATRDATDLVPWSDIERIVVTCFHLGGGEADATARAVGGNTPHVRIMRKGGEPFVYTGPHARAYHVASATELAGGESAFVHLVHDLHEQATRHGVRVALLSDVNSRWREVFPTLPVAEWSDVEHESQGS